MLLDECYNVSHKPVMHKLDRWDIVLVQSCIIISHPTSKNTYLVTYTTLSLATSKLSSVHCLLEMSRDKQNMLLKILIILSINSFLFTYYSQNYSLKWWYQKSRYGRFTCISAEILNKMLPSLLLYQQLQNWYKGCHNSIYLL